MFTNLTPRMLPPAAAKLTLADVRHAMAFFKQLEDPVAEFESALKTYFGVRNVFLFSSGRAALTTVLTAIKGNNKNEVIVPDYTCFSVPSAIAKAGLRIMPIDISPTDLDYDLESLKTAISPQTLAVIAIHPYGLACKIEEIRSICKQHEIFLIEDAAQAMGASVGGQRLGTFGDASIVSFGRGKAMTTVSGGAILTDSDALAHMIRRMNHRQTGHRYWALAMAYSLATRPIVFTLVRQLTFLEIGVTRFSIDYSISGMTPVQACLGLACLADLDDQNRVRKEHAQFYGDRLKPLCLQKECGVSLRQPVLFETAEVAERVFQALSDAGLGAGKPYPGCVSDIPEAAGLITQKTGPESGSREVVKRLLTLPTHHMVTRSDCERIVEVIQRCVG